MTTIRKSCKDYLQDCLTFFGLRNAPNLAPPAPTLADRLQIVSYFTLIIPLFIAGTFIAASLIHRVTKKQTLNKVDQAVNSKANQIFGVNRFSSNPPDFSFLKEFASLPPVEQFEIVLGTYHPHFKPKANIDNLLKYAQSDDYQRHAATARIYYNGAQLAPEDALRIIYQREPTNITMESGQYDKTGLNQTFGYECGVFNTPDAVKLDGTAFKALPHTAAVYSETFMWDPDPIDSNPKEIACLSLPAPALDTSAQPHYQYYVKNGVLNPQKYKQEMTFLFNLVEKSVRDNQKSAFGGAGLKRIVLCRFGQLAFLAGISPTDRQVANAAFREQLELFVERIKDTGLPVVMSEYVQPKDDNVWHNPMIIGDIVRTVQPGDFVVNAWDPHSAPGNGNDADGSFDGAMGRGSAIMLTQTSWLNPTLRSSTCLESVESLNSR